MIEIVLDAKVWASFFTLSVLEIVLGIDNLVFVALLAGRLPNHQQAQARRIGLTLALVMRLALLGSIAWLVHLTQPVATLFGHSFSWRDIVLIAGGAFLLFKGTHEIHLGVEGESEEFAARRAASFAWTIVQIILFDMLFSLDSVITAVGIADELWVMAAAIVSAMALMLVASGPLAAFIDQEPVRQNARLIVVAADRDDARCRRFRCSCAARLRVCGNGLFWLGRGAELACGAPAQAAQNLS
jgi:predicted tellurium resistance membrane protein TerC